ncbi:hypothetical protein PanWU01x14_276590 [Parasponia andersonii]|uniref:Uncharacterized protein n=1 Tax=Parasponia andersonii TaxID=3476 RepID=A0A2P5B2T3_PARAD|nr:hypothetical protein PanWU01x14_276590 [Parasponia andersonii]
MPREIAALVAVKDTDQALHIWQSSGGTIFLLCMIFMSLSFMSFVIFACGDTGTSSPKRRSGGRVVMGGVNCGGGVSGSGGGGGGFGGAGSGGGGC